MMSKSFHYKRAQLLSQRLKAAESALKYKPNDEARARRYTAAFQALENWNAIARATRRWGAEVAPPLPKSPYNYHNLPTKPAQIYWYHKYNSWKY
jgi:hypothetical protein